MCVCVFVCSEQADDMEEVLQREFLQSQTSVSFLELVRVT